MVSGELRTPTPAGDRIVTLDVLRGFALLGVYVVNLPSFALTSDAAYAPPTTDTWADTAAWFAVTALLMTKFVALFSLLFGMGLMLQRRRAEAAGRDFTRPYLRRLAVLAVLGLLHGVFLFVGDILFVYSVAGLALLLLHRARPRTCWILAGACFLVGACLSAVVLGSPDAPPSAAELPVWAADENVRFQDFVDTDFGEAAWPAFERKAYQTGPYRSTLLVNSVGYASWLVVSSVISFNWRVLAWFLVGAALIRQGFFEEHRRAWHVRCAWIGGTLGLALEACSTWRRFASGSQDGDLLAVLATEVGATLLTFGYLGAIALFVSSGTLPRLRAGLAAAGRMALTNYLGQSLISNALFRW